MHTQSVATWQHPHAFDAPAADQSERRTWLVIGITTVMMVAEIWAGQQFGSMALLADGWHMGTHAAALGVTAFAYLYARKHAKDRRFSFGTGKVTALGGFASAVGLAMAAVLVLFESFHRLRGPLHINFNEAIAVAAIGLLVNLVSAWLLRGEEGGHGHHHGHAHGHDHGHDHAKHAHHSHDDHALRGAYLHVLADAMTSLFAIAALLLGKHYGLLWLDPMMGVLGAVVVGRWSIGLLRDTSQVLLDAEPSESQAARIKAAIEAEADNRVADLHLWRVGPKHSAAIISIVSHNPSPPNAYKAMLREFDELSHVTVEVHTCPGPHA